MTGHPVRNAILLGTATLVVIGVLSWLFVLSPRLSQASDITAQTESVATANLALQGRYNQRLDMARQAPQAATDAVELFTTMPQQADLPDVLRQITDAASAAGIAPRDVTSIRTSVPVPLAIPAPAGPGETAAPEGAQLAELPLEIAVKGPRKSLLAFVENIQALDRAVLIDSTNYNQSVGAQEMLTISGSLFMLESELPDLVAQVKDLLSKAEAVTPTAP